MSRYVPLADRLTPTEAAAQRELNKTPKCDRCVNGEPVFDRVVCMADKKWPKCIEQAGGYQVKA